MDKFLDEYEKKRYFCKSDINKNFLKSIHLEFMSVKDAKDLFDELIEDGVNVIKRLTGMKDNQNYRRHTKFVNSYYFYRKAVKG